MVSMGRISAWVIGELCIMLDLLGKAQSHGSLLQNGFRNWAEVEIAVGMLLAIMGEDPTQGIQGFLLFVQPTFVGLMSHLLFYLIESFPKLKEMLFLDADTTLVF